MPVTKSDSAPFRPVRATVGTSGRSGLRPQAGPGKCAKFVALDLGSVDAERPRKQVEAPAEQIGDAPASLYTARAADLTVGDHVMSSTAIASRAVPLERIK